MRASATAPAGESARAVRFFVPSFLSLLSCLSNQLRRLVRSERRAVSPSRRPLQPSVRTMGSGSSAQAAPAEARQPAPVRRSVHDGSTAMRNPRSSVSMARASFARSSSLLGASLLGMRRMSNARRGSVTSGNYEIREQVHLKLGDEADAARPPARKIIITGPRQSGKSTLIRQLGILFSLQSGEQDRLKYKKEVHKAALLAFQALLREVHEAEQSEAVSELLGLRERAQITPSVAESLARAFSTDEVQAALSRMGDIAAKVACTYFMSRLQHLAAPGFVPEPTDLLYINIPTSGRQETRLRGTPGGPLSVLEISITAFVQEKGLREMREQGLAAVVFLASASDLSTKPSGNDGAATVAKAEVCAQEDKKPGGTDVISEWYKVLELAAAVNLPACIIVSKCDLLSIASSGGGVGVSEAQLLSAFAATPASCISSLDGSATRSSFLGLMKGPLQLDDSDEPAALQEGCYLGLALFATAPDGSEKILLHQRAIPHTLIQAEPLNLEDQLWLHRLPQPIPNPARATSDEAARLGKGSTSGMPANFWVGICSLARMLGYAEPAHLGVLHPMPLLMPPGTAMLIIACTFGRDDALRFPGAPRTLRWRNTDDAAFGMAGAMPASELLQFSRNRKRSYASDIEVQRKVSLSDLHPRNWLSKVREANKAQCAPVEQGTYVSALYLTSSAQGLQVLLSSTDTSMLPSVKVSNRLIDGIGWLQLQDLIVRLYEGDVDESLVDWAKAKAWLGPDVTTEDVFSDVQKFFYGVVALRQILGRHCSPMKDMLRYSQREQAQDSLMSLGKPFPNKHAVVMDETAKTRVIIMVKFYAMECPDKFPSGYHWHPLELFEARNSARLLRKSFEQYIWAKQHLQGRKARAAASMSVNLSERSQCSQASSTRSDKDEEQANTDVSVEPSREGIIDWDAQLEAAWDRLRWLKDATLWAASTERSLSTTPCDVQGGSDHQRNSMTRLSSVGPMRRGSSVTPARRRRLSSKPGAEPSQAKNQFLASMQQLESVVEALQR